MTQRAQPRFGQRSDLVLAPKNLAATGVNQAQQTPCKGGFTRARFAHHAHGFASTQGQTGVMQSAVGVVGFTNRQGTQQRRRVRNAPRRWWRHAGHGRQQLAGVGCLRGMQHLVAAAQLDRNTSVHHQHLIGNVSHYPHVVGDEQHRASRFLLQSLNQLQDVFLGGDVQSGGRFVTDQQGGLHDHGHGNHDALALTAAQLMRIALPHALGVGQTHLRQHVQHRAAALTGRPIGVCAQQFIDLLAAAHHGVECGHGFLKHHAHGATAQSTQPCLTGVQQGLALQLHHTACHCQFFVQQSHDGGGQHRFARAGFADHAQRFTCV